MEQRLEKELSSGRNKAPTMTDFKVGVAFSVVEFQKNSWQGITSDKVIENSSRSLAWGQTHFERLFGRGLEVEETSSSAIPSLIHQSFLNGANLGSVEPSMLHGNGSPARETRLELNGLNLPTPDLWTTSRL